jgi:hypothetical protein
MMSINFLRIVLALAGAAIVVLGLNVGGGGIATLGWQGPTDFFEIVDARAFAIHDNHVRFLGGLWLGVGLTFLAAAFKPHLLKRVILTLCMLIFIGGLARLSASNPLLIFSADLGPSVFTELVLFPLLAIWIHRQLETARDA